MNGGPGAYKARKTPTKIYPSSPPRIPTGVEVLYQAIREEILTGITSSFHDRIVASQILYKPAILAGARINFHGNRWQLHFEKDLSRIVPFPSKQQFCDWDANLKEHWEPQESRSLPEQDALFDYDSTYDFSEERFAELQDDFRRHLISSIVLAVEYNPHLKLERQLDESAESFMSRCMEKTRVEFDKEKHNVKDTLQRLYDRLKQKLDREMQDLDDEQHESERHDSNEAIRDIQKEIEQLQTVRKSKMNELEENLSTIAKEREKDVLRLNNSNLSVLRFALIWLPYTEYVIQEQDSRRLELVQSF